jgi:hypothetical protein
VADDVVLVVDAVAAVHVARHARDVQRLAAAVALDQADHLGRGAAFVEQPPTRRQACRPRVISVCMSASFFWMSWFCASGRPNCLRSSVYWRAACQQNSAAPSAPQAMP